tara:strand:- start:220 stop:549 length:330 start_codon:yes stop_codon:yes gene_type:complete
MKFSISTLTDLFHQFPVSDAYRTDKFREALNDKFVDYCAKDSRDGQNVIRKFLIHEVESSWIAKSNGNAVISADVVEVEGGENRQITMTVGRIEKVNGQDVPQVVKWEG